MKVDAGGLRVKDALRLLDLALVAERNAARKGARYRDALDFLDPVSLGY